MTRMEKLHFPLLILALALPGSVRTLQAHPDETAVSTLVYVSSNGSCYHRAECPRLRFAEPIPLSEAERAYRPCPVCVLAAASGVVPITTGAQTDGLRPTNAEVSYSRGARSPRSSPGSGAPTVAAAPRAGSESTPPARLEVPASIPTAAETRHGARHSRGSHVRRGALIGLAAGAALGLSLGGSDELARAEAALTLGGWGAGIGAVVGLLVPIRGDRALTSGRAAVRRARIAVVPENIAKSYRLESTEPRGALGDQGSALTCSPER